MDARLTFVEGIQIREGRGQEPTWIGGYAAVFHQETIIEAEGGVRWRERIAPQAFTEAITRDDVIAAVNHDSKQVLGRSKAGTLTLRADAHGLRYDVKLPQTSLARDTVENIRSGNYPGSSFKFLASRDGLRIDPPTHGADLPLITIERVELIDVGPVTFPAYAGTSVSARDARVVTDLLASYDVAMACAVRERQRQRVRVARAWS